MLVPRRCQAKQWKYQHHQIAKQRPAIRQLILMAVEKMAIRCSVEPINSCHIRASGRRCWHHVKCLTLAPKMRGRLILCNEPCSPSATPAGHKSAHARSIITSSMPDGTGYLRACELWRIALAREPDGKACADSILFTAFAVERGLRAVPPYSSFDAASLISAATRAISPTLLRNCARCR